MLRRTASLVSGGLLHFRNCNSGNVAVVVGLCLVPLLLGVGAAVDTARVHNAQTKVQADLDFALIAAVNEIGTEDKARISAKLEDWFRSQQTADEGVFTIEDVRVDLDQDTVKATVTGSVPTTLMGLAGYESMLVEVTSSALGADKPHMQILFALDKSASMLLAATPEGQAKMISDVGCAFACHVDEGGTEGTGYRTRYDYSRAHDILLRVDVARQALSDSLGVIEAADPANERIKVGLFKIGTRAEKVLEPTLTFPVVRQRLAQDAYGMTGSTSDEITDFQESLQGLTGAVGASGDGKLPDSPEKLVLLVTDGVHSQRAWVHGDTDKTSPLNPKWCAGLKSAGVTVAVLYTEYLPMPRDWGYNATVGSTMDAANWKVNWNGDRRAGIPGSITRHDYIPYALKDCASSEDLFLSAASESEIRKGIRDLLRSFLSAPRLTQ
jgi:Flp pilus assembly protein TadG